jgi:tRNA uridine 5-carbamoylmethylation protein Kti12
MTNVKITLTGAGGVGKTTLAERLSEVLNVPLIPEIARVLCRERGYSRIGDIADQEGFKFDVLEKQSSLEDQLDSFVADRSAIDCWVLWQRWNICSAMTYDTERMYGLCSKRAQLYTHVIYIPPLFVPVEDEFRWTDPDYIKQVDRLVRMTLQEQELWNRTLTISSLTTEDRMQEVSEWLQ